MSDDARPSHAPPASLPPQPALADAGPDAPAVVVDAPETVGEAPVEVADAAVGELPVVNAEQTAAEALDVAVAPARGGVGAWLLREWPTLLFMALAAALVWWISVDAWGPRLITDSQGTDYWEHSGVARAMLQSPFKPGSPHVVGTENSPRYSPLMLAFSLLGRAAGFDALAVMGLASTVHLCLFCAGVFAFFRVWARSAVAPLLGLLVMTGAWLDGYHFSNVYQLRVLFSVASYPSTAAIGLTLLSLAALVSQLRASRPSWWWIGAFGLGVAVTMAVHQLTVMVLLVLAALFIALEPSVPLRRRLLLGGALVGGLLAAELWPYYSSLEVLRGGRGSRPWAADVAARIAAGGIPRESLQFYTLSTVLANVGVGVLGVHACSAWFAQRRHLPIALGAWVLLGPYVVNAYLPITLGHRFLLLAMVPFHIATVGALLAIVPGGGEPWPALLPAYRWVRGLAAAAVVLLMFGLVAFQLRDTFTARARGFASRGADRNTGWVVRNARAVAASVGPKAVVLAPPQVSWPLPTFGVRVVALHHQNPLLTDRLERLDRARAFFRAGASAAERENTLQRFHVTHVLAPRGAPRDVQEFLRGRARQQPTPIGPDLLYVLR